MLRSLSTGTTGIQAFQNQLDVIGNNIANANTTGFKSGRADFADTFSQTLGAGGTPSMQIGNGVSTSGIKSMFTRGNITETGVPTDLALPGDGFFVVSNPDDGLQYATRAGDFSLDGNGYLVTNGGLRVQGYNSSALTTQGDIQIDLNDTSVPAGAVSDRYSIESSGKIIMYLTDGTEITRGQILLQRFTDPQALVKVGDNLFTGFVAAGALGGTTPQAEVPGTNGLSTIRSGALEGSNVDLTSEFASLITTQRGFQANARIITTSDEILQELVNLKR